MHKALQFLGVQHYEVGRITANGLFISYEASEYPKLYLTC